MEPGSGQNAPATKADLSALLGEFRKSFATKEDLERFATKEDLERFATKEDVARCASKEDLERFATKEDMLSIRDELKNDIAGVWREASDLRRHVSNEEQRTRDEVRMWRAESSRRMRRLEARSR